MVSLSRIQKEFFEYKDISAGPDQRIHVIAYHWISLDKDKIFELVLKSFLRIFQIIPNPDERDEYVNEIIFYNSFQYPLAG